MRTALVLALLTAAPSQVQLERQQIRPTRVMRVLRAGERGGSGAPFFEAFIANGSGAGAACACTNVTGSRGETSTTTRANSLDCRKGGPWATSGIAVGDIVTCASNQPRVELDVDGTLGLEAWGGFVQTALRSDELGNAVWTSTEAVTSNDATAPDNTATADRLNDTNGAVQSCTSQVIATTSATHHVVSVYVRGGSVSEAQISMTGTGSAAGDCSATVTGLSTSTWNRLWCKSSSAYAGTLTAVTVSVCVGDAVGDIGTVFAWRYNHSVNFPSTLLYPPPSLQAVAASATTAYEYVTFTLPTALSSSSGSVAVSFTPAWTSGLASPLVGPQLVWLDSSGRPMYGPASANAMRIFDGLNDVGNAISWTGGTTVRPWSSYAGSTLTINDGSDTATGSFDGTFGAGALTSVVVGGSSSAGISAYGIITRVCADPRAARCR